MDKAAVRSKLLKIVPAGNHTQDEYFANVDKVMQIVQEEVAHAQFVATLQQEQWDNLMRRMVRHPNNSLIDFMERHVPNQIYDERVQKIESFEAADIG